MFERLAAFEQRLEVLDRMLSDPEVLSDPRRVRDLSREHRHVDAIVTAWRAVRATEAEIADLRELSADGDPEVRELARAELPDLSTRLEERRQELRLLLIPKDPHDGRPILLEIRAGTGGDEAALFAGTLFRMYSRFAERVGLRVDILSSQPVTAAGGSGKSSLGFKEIIASVAGEAAYTLLRFESGVHRVQRVPVTESQGRIHTSAATVAVLPEPDEVEVTIDPNDLEIHRMRAGGPGGQSVNTTDSAVRIVHKPSGITVQCQDEKSQVKNKAKALRVLKARLLEQEQASRHAEEAAERRSQVGTGDRSERIRTYNFPQNRLTDHRINLTLYKLDAIVDGDLHEMIDHLTAEHQARMLAASGG